MRGMCNTCEKILVCKKLCPEAEKYANQDYVPVGVELTGIRIENHDSNDAFGHDKNISVNFENPTILKIVIVKLYLDGKPTRKIAEYVPCSRRYVREIIDYYNKEKKNVGKNRTMES